MLASDDILFSDEDFSNVTFYANEMEILGAYLDKINLDNNYSFYEDDPHTGYCDSCQTFGFV